LAIGAAAAWVLKPAGPEPLPPPILSMEKMGHLVAVRVNYSDVFEFTEKRTIDIPWTNYEWRLGGTTVLLVARGDCTVAANLSAAKYERKDDKARSLDVVLPLPQPLSARINHDAREKRAVLTFMRLPLRESSHSYRHPTVSVKQSIKL
jgi:hypothetical protein